MLESLWEILKKKEGLLEEGRKKSLEMLSTVKEQYTLVMQALQEDTNGDVRQKVWTIDKEINRKQMEVREMVYEHLAISSAKDLLTGLQLANVVIDLERAGDYTKNISELLEMFPGKLDFAQHESTFNEVRLLILGLFEESYRAFEDQDRELAHDIVHKYDHISKTCDALLKQIISSETPADAVGKNELALVLMLRYMKRVGAHLKNIATAVANPFPRFGYRAGSS